MKVSCVLATLVAAAIVARAEEKLGGYYGGSIGSGRYEDYIFGMQGQSYEGFDTIGSSVVAGPGIIEQGYDKLDGYGDLGIKGGIITEGAEIIGDKWSSGWGKHLESAHLGGHRGFGHDVIGKGYGIGGYAGDVEGSWGKFGGGLGYGLHEDFHGYAGLEHSGIIKGEHAIGTEYGASLKGLGHDGALSKPWVSSIGYGYGTELEGAVLEGSYGIGAGYGFAEEVVVEPEVVKQEVIEVPVNEEIYVDRPYPVDVPYPVNRPYGVKVPIPVDRPYPKEVRVAIPEPHPVPIKVQVPFPEPYPVELPVPVDKPYPVIVEKKVAIPEPYAVEEKITVVKPYPVEVKFPVPEPYPVTKEIPIDRPYPVYVDKKVPIPQPYPVEVKVPYPVYIPKPYPVEVKVPIKQPYPVEVKVGVPEPYPVVVEKTIPVPEPYTVERKVPIPKPYPVEVKVPVDRPYPVAVPKPYTVEKVVPKPEPYPVAKPFPVTVERKVTVDRPRPYPVAVPKPYPVPMKEKKF